MSGCVTRVADDGRRGIHFLFPVGKDVAKFLPSVCGKEERRLPRNVRGRSRGRVPIGGGIHAKVTRGGVGVPVPERSSRRRKRGTGVDAGADDHQPPDPSAGSWHGG